MSLIVEPDRQDTGRRRQDTGSSRNTYILLKHNGSSSTLPAVVWNQTPNLPILCGTSISIGRWGGPCLYTVPIPTYLPLVLVRQQDVISYHVITSFHIIFRPTYLVQHFLTTSYIFTLSNEASVSIFMFDLPTLYSGVSDLHPIIGIRVLVRCARDR